MRCGLCHHGTENGLYPWVCSIIWIIVHITPMFFNHAPGTCTRGKPLTICASKPKTGRTWWPTLPSSAKTWSWSKTPSTMPSTREETSATSTTSSKCSSSTNHFRWAAFLRVDLDSEIILFFYNLHSFSIKGIPLPLSQCIQSAFICDSTISTGKSARRPP